MRILVVDNNRIEREATVRCLPSDSHDVKVANDAAAALAILDEREVDVVIVESTLTGMTGTELIKRIRARESNTHTYVVVTASRLVPGDVKNAFLAGADDFMRKALSRDELVARIEGPSRIMRWASRVIAMGASAEFSKKTDLSTMAAWGSIDTSISSEVADMLGMSLEVVPAKDVLDGSIAVSTLPLSLASESAEVCLAVGVDDEAARSLAEAMFGDPGVDVSAIKDMMREIANVAAGAFKRVAAAEGRTFTTGLPNEATPTSFRKANAKARRQWLVACDDSPVCLRFEVELRIRETKRLPVSGLREGMVVAADLLNEAGALLMRGGTRITESHLTGMKRALGERVLVEVAEVA